MTSEQVSDLAGDVDVAIIGAGLAGAAAAWELTRRGHSVVVLEQFTVNHLLGSSHGSSRIFRRAYAEKFYLDLTGQAAASWDALEDDCGIALRTTTGGIDAGAMRKPAELVALLRAHGVAAQLLSPAQVQQRWPGMRVDGPAMFHPDAGHLDANAAVRAMLDLAATRGATIVEHSPVRRIENTAHGVAVRTDTVTVRAKNVVVAAGAWLPELLAGGAVTTSAEPGTPGMPLVPQLTVKQQEVFHFTQLHPEVRYPTLVYKGHNEFYALASGGDGGAAPAMKFGQFDSISTTTAAGRDGVIDPRARDAVQGYVRTWMPGLDPTPVAENSCLFTMTPDHDFVVDRVGATVIVSPCSGHGAKFAPLIGTWAADLVEGKPSKPRFAFRN